MRSILSPVLFAACVLQCAAQADSLWQVESQTAALMEALLQRQDGASVEDFNTLPELWEDYLRRPLHLNRADAEEMRESGLFNAPQIAGIIQHRESTGPIISLLELQTIPGFSAEEIRKLAPFLTTGSNLDDYELSIPKMLAAGQHTLFLRWSAILEKQRGFSDAQAENTRFLGNPHQYYVRYRQTYSNKLSLGLTAEKDRGEEFFRGSNPYGFDFYAFHFALRQYTQTLKTLVIGDFTANFGQGLILAGGFQGGKGGTGIHVKRSGRTIAPYTSVNEDAHFRGAAATFSISPALEFSGFLSRVRRSAFVLQPDTALENAPDGEAIISSLNLSGLHRNQREIEGKNASLQTHAGVALKWKKQSNHLSVNGIICNLNPGLPQRDELYARYYFSGSQLVNVSIDYGWMWRSFHFYGEQGMSPKGATALLNGVMFSMDRRTDATILYRRYARNFQTLTGDGFGEIGGTRNESGIFMGLETRPARGWKANIYFDQWMHPWLRFNAGAPSRGNEFRFRLTYEIRKQLTAHAEVRLEQKELNATNNQNGLNYLNTTQLRQARLFLSQQIHKSLELRTRLDVGAFEDGTGAKLNGVAIFQDVLFRPVGFPLWFTARYALFDTDGYAVRFYAYENNLLYQFSIPAYYETGYRFYLNIRYRPIQSFTIEGRLAQTWWSKATQIGSGLDTIDGPARTQLSAQLRWQF
jgi:hypothetical protein